MFTGRIVKLRDELKGDHRKLFLVNVRSKVTEKLIQVRIKKDRILQNRQSSPDTARLHFFCFFRSNVLVLQDEFKTIYIAQEGMGREQERKGCEITMISSDL